MRTVRALESGVLDDAPEHLGECLTAVVAPVDLAAPSDPSAARARKRAWVAATTEQWGTCGQVLLVDDRVVGAVLYAPAAFLPGLARLPTAPVSPDAVAMASLLVAVGHDERGAGRVLVQAMARDLVRRHGTCGDVRAVEAICGGDDACAPRAVLCGAVGFREWRDHPAYPRVRLDLRGTVSWRDGLGRALARLRAGVRAPAASPTHRGGC